jgi:hypothetical protein
MLNIKNLCLFVAALLFLGACAPQDYHPREGDLIFQSLPQNDLVNAIEGATRSPYSHVGIVIRSQDAWYVREALGVVHDTRLGDFLGRGREGKYDVYRLKPEYTSTIPRIIEATNEYLGLPYDARYRMDDEFIYCSELIYKAYKNTTNKELGELVELGSLDWGKYETIITSLEGGPVPVHRQMITPRDLAKAEQLRLVYSSY